MRFIIRGISKDNTKTLYQLLTERNIFVDAPCGGRGICGKCRIRCITGAPEPLARERELFTARELDDGLRLSCISVPKEDITLELPDEQDNMKVLAAASGNFLPSAGITGYGIAFDIGTTTLAMALVNAATGETVAVKTAANRQRAYGADVLSRIRAAGEGASSALTRLIRSDGRNMIRSLLMETRIRPEAVKRIVIAGNTTMCYLLRGLPCQSLGEYPFTAEHLAMVKTGYGELFGAGELSAEVIILPGISAFIGPDIVAGLYAADILSLTIPAFFLDIGTNGEMAIKTEKGLFVTSTAAGPVFEGGGISSGMPAVEGAVSHLALTRTGHGIESICETIGDKPPKGLCGSGVIDFVAELWREKLMDENGTLAKPWFSVGVPFAGGAYTFTQQDIRNFQLGKAAIRTGMEFLLERCGEKEREQVRLYLAGGFGCFLNPENAIRIGMLPAGIAEKPVLLGNAALAGCIRFLLEKGEASLTALCESATELVLAAEPGFEEQYIKNMGFCETE